jgi:hypothetical protein
VTKHASIFVLCLLASYCFPASAHAQGGPPYITNDPGTPGNDNWEINIASQQIVRQGVASYQVPQFDINFGIGDRIQLTYEVPFTVQTAPGQPTQSAWSNAFAGVKWRFWDHGENSWQISIFPQFETGSSLITQEKGISINGPRLYFPVEVAKKVGPLDVNFEAGYFFPWHGPYERTLGLVAGHQFTRHLEFDGEVYNDWVMGTLPHDTFFDFGGRYEFHTGLIALFMAGRSFSGNSSGQPEYLGYFGIQILLSKFGRTLTPDAEP